MKTVVLAGAEGDPFELRACVKRDSSNAVWQKSYAKLMTAVRRLAKSPKVEHVPLELDSQGLQ